MKAYKIQSEASAELIGKANKDQEKILGEKAGKELPSDCKPSLCSTPIVFDVLANSELLK